MKTVLCELESISPYSQSKYINEKKPTKEDYNEFEKRVWRQRMHLGPNGKVFIPPMAFKWALDGAAGLLGMKVPGGGQKRFKGIFTSGILIVAGLELPINGDDVASEWLLMNANGRRGSGTRVERCFPVIPQWSGQVEINVLNEIITEEVFREHLEAAGQFIGIGRFRPQNGGYYGRFNVASIAW